MTCLYCYEQMRPEGAHYRCDNCGQLTTCCEGEPQ